MSDVHRVVHENSGYCHKCRQIIDTYPGFDEVLLEWFLNLQYLHPEAHISCAGRGKIEQTTLFQRGATLAQWEESAHNWNAALDLFVLLPGSSNIYPINWFRTVLAQNLTGEFTWYGEPGSPFYELPHIQRRGWKELAKAGKLTLVE